VNGLDLFSGIGGLSLALAPWVRPIAYCENDRWAQALLLSRMSKGQLPRAAIWDDVRTLTSETISEMLEGQREAESMSGKLKKLTQEQVDESVRSYQQGMSLADLSHIFSVTRQAMWDLLRRRTTMGPQKRFGKENHFYRGGARADARAHDILEKAVLNGKLLNPGKCEICGGAGTFVDGRAAIQAHHDDYNKPLSVRWLCQKCHYEWHRKNKPVPAREGGEKEAPAVDIIYGGFP